MRADEDRQSARFDLVDPDPFSIALGIFQIVAAGGTFLESRRQRSFVDRTQRESFRASWFAARRTLIHFERVIDEFETYMLEDDYGAMVFRIGAVRLAVDRGRHQALRRLHGQTTTTASFMADNLDDLSDHLGPDDRDRVEGLLDQLSRIVLPEQYRDVIRVARDALEGYRRLLDEIDTREGFSRQGA